MAPTLHRLPLALSCLLCGAILGASGQAAFAARARPARDPAPLPAAPPAYSRYAKLDVFARALAYIEQDYVRPVDDGELIYAALDGMTQALDPHTNFLRPVDARMLREDIEGSFGGVGLIVVTGRAGDGATLLAAGSGGETGVGSEGSAGVAGTPQCASDRAIVMVVREVLPTSPAAGAGLRTGDEIVSIEGRAVGDFADLREAIAAMRGRAGTQVRFAWQRPHEPGQRETTLTRAIVEAPAVESRYLGDGVGVVRLRDFQASGAQAVREALRKLDQEAGGELRGLTLDLRDNGGGLLDQAVAVADIFLASGTIVRTRGRGARVTDEAHALPAGTRKDLPLVVLINRATASASEIVAGALQDHGRALIVGEPSYGKGSVQEPRPLGDGSVLKLTVALFYTPADHVIQARGIQPDISAGMFSPPSVDSRAELDPERADPRALGADALEQPLAGSRAEEARPSPAIEAARADPQLRVAVEHLVGMVRTGARPRARHRLAPGEAPPAGESK